MGRIYPLHEEVVNQFCGYPVGVIMNDGTRHVGILSSCGGGRLLLNGGNGGVGISEANLTEAQTQISKKKKGVKGKMEITDKSAQKKLQTQAYPYDPYYYDRPYNPWGEALFLDLALIAFLFLLI